MFAAGQKGMVNAKYSGFATILVRLGGGHDVFTAEYVETGIILDIMTGGGDDFVEFKTTVQGMCYMKAAKAAPLALRIALEYMPAPQYTIMRPRTC